MSRTCRLNRDGGSRRVLVCGQNGAEIQAHADSHLNGEGIPQFANQTDEQKDHVLTLVFQNKSSWTIKWVIGKGGSWTRAIIVAVTMTRGRRIPRFVRKHLGLLVDRMYGSNISCSHEFRSRCQSVFHLLFLRLGGFWRDGAVASDWFV